jgi:hypothetical protein
MPVRLPPPGGWPLPVTLRPSRGQLIRYTCDPRQNSAPSCVSEPTVGLWQMSFIAPTCRSPLISCESTSRPRLASGHHRSHLPLLAHLDHRPQLPHPPAGKHQPPENAQDTRSSAEGQTSHALIAACEYVGQLVASWSPAFTITIISNNESGSAIVASGSSHEQWTAITYWRGRIYSKPPNGWPRRIGAGTERTYFSMPILVSIVSATSAKIDKYATP